MENKTTPKQLKDAAIEKALYSDIVQTVEELLGREARAFFVRHYMMYKKEATLELYSADAEAIINFSRFWAERNPMDCDLLQKMLFQVIPMIWNTRR
jgi:hypothetical protein